MRLLLDSLAGDALGLVSRLEREGHTVQVAIAREDSGRVGDGIVDKVDDAVAAADDADLVVFDQVGRGSIADLLRDSGVPVLGASRAMDVLELDRIRAMDVFRGLGLSVPKYEVFAPTDLERALRYVEQRGTKLVFKPSGNLGTDKTFLAEDADEMLEYLEHLAETLRGEDSGFPAFLLQDFVVGAECSSERWYAQGKPVPALDNHTVEAKKQLAGDLGPATGCAANAVFGPDAALIAQTVAKLDRYAAIHGLTGPLDLNAIVDDKTGKPMILECTARFGYHALEANTARWNMPLGETFDALAHGEVPAVKYSAPVGVAIPVAIPPYPNEGAAKARGMPIVDDVEEDPDVWLGDVMRDAETDRLVCAGSDGVVYIRTATASTAAEAYAQVYRALADSRLPDRMWRSDIAEWTVRKLKHLRSLGITLRG